MANGKDFILGTIDLVLFIFTALFLSFIMLKTIPDYKRGEPVGLTILLLIVQLGIDILLIFGIDYLFRTTFKRDPNLYLGLYVFTVILIMPQVQIFDRIAVIFYHLKSTEMITSRQNILKMFTEPTSK